ncbi:hypothetical protein IAT38_008231 [Cryptococcus sp. DSM 104549]
MSHSNLKRAPPMYPPRPPPGFRRRLWKWSIRFQSTFALATMDPWEKVVTLSFFSIVTLLFWISVYLYLPANLAYFFRRVAYYIHGDEAAQMTRWGGGASEWVKGA